MTTTEVAYIVNSILWSLLGLMVGYILGQVGNVFIDLKEKDDDS